MVQTGDVVNKGKSNEGQSGRSIYGTSFADEDLSKLKHVYGALSMASSGAHTNSSQFMIVTDKQGAENLDGKHVVFGKLSEESMEVLDKIEGCAEMFERDGKERARITKECKIVGCGEL